MRRVSICCEGQPEQEGEAKRVFRGNPVQGGLAAWVTNQSFALGASILTQQGTSVTFWVKG